MNRRQMLGALAGCAAGGVLGERSLWSDAGKPWGSFPAWAQSLALPATLQPKNILEVFLLGGISPWESFYCVPDAKYGKSANAMWWTFQEGPNSLPALLAKYTKIALTPQPFATDLLGAGVCLGPLTDPLRSRPDLVARLRTLVLSHGVFPHTPAISVGLSGLLPSAPRAASMGTAIQRRQLALQGKPGKLPWAYSLTGDELRQPFGDTIGKHPGICQPLTILVNPSASFVGQLGQFKAWLDQAASTSGLRQALQQQNVARMTRPGAVEPVRAPLIKQHSGATIQVAQATGLGDVLVAKDFAGPAGTAGGESFAYDRSKAMFTVAAKLLTLPGEATRYVLVNDSGYSENSPMPDGYDFHVKYAPRAVARLPYVLQRLVNTIAVPGQAIPGQINLDDTLVVLNTEFGRSPGVQNGGDGRNHHPAAYTVQLLGGPAGLCPKGIVGAIDANANPSKAVSPAELRMALLMAMGIWPFEGDLFSYGDVQGAANETQALMRLRTQILGVPL